MKIFAAARHDVAVHEAGIGQTWTFGIMLGNVRFSVEKGNSDRAASDGCSASLTVTCQ